jgi:hypothetical protein
LDHAQELIDRLWAGLGLNRSIDKGRARITKIGAVIADDTTIWRTDTAGVARFVRGVIWQVPLRPQRPDELTGHDKRIGCIQPFPFRVKMLPRAT